jgi:hypothetical protein
MDVWATLPTLELAARNKVPALVVLNRVLPRANLTEEMVDELRALHAGVARTTIGNRVLFAGALSEGRAVGEVQPRSRAAQEIGARGGRGAAEEPRRAGDRGARQGDLASGQVAGKRRPFAKDQDLRTRWDSG